MIVSKKEELNIIITGKSGAGKSSFLNYLIGEDHFKVGEGVPVTQAYFEDYVYETSDTHVRYHLYDTKGIEPTTTTECRNQVFKEIERRDKLSMFEWIHTVYYCFDASAKRIQPFEIQFINELKNRVSIVILLTKKDLVSQIDLNALINQIENEIDNKVQIIPICSVEKITRKGISVREGKEEVLKASFLGLWERLANTFPNMNVSFLLEKKAFPSSFMSIIKNAEKELCNKELKDKSDFKNFKKFVEEGISVDMLSHFPLLKNTDYTNIKFMKPIIISMMEESNKFVETLFNKIDLMDIEAVWTKNANIHREIFAFYQKVNKVKPRILYSDLAKESMLSIKTHMKWSSYNKLKDLTKQTRTQYKDLECTWFFDAEERLAITNSYDEYRDYVMRIGIELNLLISNFLSLYKAELKQYGQYCLKKQTKKENLSIIESESEFDNDEKIYYSVLRACLYDRKIEERERFMLEQLMEVLQISKSRAGLIEDFARTH